MRFNISAIAIVLIVSLTLSQTTGLVPNQKVSENEIIQVQIYDNGKKAVLVEEDFGLHIINIRNINKPKLINSYKIDDFSNSKVDIDDENVYISVEGNRRGWIIVDISNPSSIQEMFYKETNMTVTSIDYHRNRIYYTMGNQLQVFEYRNETHYKVLETIELNAQSEALYLSDNLVYVASSGNISIYKINFFGYKKQISIPTQQPIKKIMAQDNLLVTLHPNSGFTVYNITNIEFPRGYSTINRYNSQVVDIELNEKLLFVASNPGGIEIFGYSYRNYIYKMNGFESGKDYTAVDVFEEKILFIRESNDGLVENLKFVNLLDRNRIHATSFEDKNTYRYIANPKFVDMATNPNNKDKIIHTLYESNFENGFLSLDLGRHRYQKVDIYDHKLIDEIPGKISSFDEKVIFSSHANQTNNVNSSSWLYLYDVSSSSFELLEKYDTTSILDNSANEVIDLKMTESALFLTTTDKLYVFTYYSTISHVQSSNIPLGQNITAIDVKLPWVAISDNARGLTLLKLGSDYSIGESSIIDQSPVMDVEITNNFVYYASKTAVKRVELDDISNVTTMLQQESDSISIYKDVVISSLKPRENFTSGASVYNMTSQVNVAYLPMTSKVVDIVILDELITILSTNGPITFEFDTLEYPPAEKAKVRNTLLTIGKFIIIGVLVIFALMFLMGAGLAALVD